MATATPTKPNPAAAREAAVERAIATAAGKVRANDLLTGAAAAAVLLLGYLAAVVTLDRLLDLPGWVRLLGLLGLVGGLAAVVYLLIVRPMQRRVNPRYVARKMEETLPDAKNVLINWVDLQEEQLPGSVKAAVATKAAAGVADADVDSATNSRLLIWLGSAAGILVLVLAVLFLVFSGPQFMSLLQRAVVPFKQAEIASATTITVTQPDGGDVTISDLQKLTVDVTIDGRQPDPNGPDKPRLLLRYSPDAPVAKEIPLAPVAGSSDKFTIELGRSDILNGVYYQVAAGDARTPEYKVTVVTRPMLSDFKATYEYPAYLKWPNDTEAGTKLEALRGTTVTLTAKANRTVKSTTLTAFTVDGDRELVRGEVFGDKRDQVRFRLTLRKSGTYRIEFRPTDADYSTPTADYPIEVKVDAKPTVSITKPAEEEIQLPLNGLLAVDGKVRDDHGIARIELRFQVEGNESLAVRPKAYRNGEPLNREKDDTLITDLTGEGGPDAPVYKDSVRLDQLSDADGKPLKLKEGDVLVYWLAAIDNCTEPKANEGESAPKKRVRLVAPPKEPEKKQEQANKEQRRKNEEKKGEQKLDQQRKNETRPENENRNPDKDPQQPKQPEGQPGEMDPKGEGDPMKGDTPPEKKEGQPDGKQDGKQEDGKGGDTPPQDKDFQQKAEQLKKDIEKRKQEEKEQAGQARGDGDPSQGQETKPDATTKPPEGKPGDAGSKGAAEGKEGPKPEDMTKPEGQPSQGKDAGTLTDPKRSEPKDAPKPDAKGNEQPAGDRPKDAPKDGTDAGTAKESKADPSSRPNDPKQPQDPMGGNKQEPKKDGSAGSARGAEPPQEKEGQRQDPMGNGGNDQPKPGQEKKADPKDLGGSKPKGEPTRGDTKPEPKQGEGQKGEEKKDAGGAKGDTPNKPGESKDQPKGADGQPMEKKGPPQDATQEKQPPKDGAGGKEGAAEPKGEGKQPDDPKGGEKGTAKPSDTKKPEGGKGEDKKDPMGTGEKNPNKTDPMGNGSGEKQPDMKDPMSGGGADGKKLDPKEMEQAIKDLDSKDPKTKKDAQEKLDQAVGKENREQIEQAQKDAKSDDPAKRDAAKQKLEDMAKKGQGQPGDKTDAPKPKELTEQEKKDLADAASKLDSKDPKEKQAAQEKLDKAIGKENREQVEQMQKDLKSDNKETREAAEKKLQEMAKQAQQQQNGTAKKPEMTEEQRKELADAARKLNSKDEAERKAAEKKMDDAIGPKNREELQQDLKDLQGNDPAKAEQAKKKLEKKIEEAKNAQNGNSDKHNDNPDRLGGGNSTAPGKPLDANLENQLKSRELALDDFKKYRGNKEFLKENNFTDAEYERFLQQEEAAVQKLREKVDQARVNPTPEAGGPATLGRNEFSGGRVTGRGSADKIDGSSNRGVPPPGFGPAVQRFNQEASKQPQK